ncbi:MAG: hypothetical protein AAF333_04115 [Planctomycetota bacterium]
MAHERLAALLSAMREVATLPEERGRDQQFGHLLREAVESEDALDRPEDAAALAAGRKALGLGAYHIAIPAIGRALLGPASQGQSWDRQDDLHAICDAIAEQIESTTEPEATLSVGTPADPHAVAGDRPDETGYVDHPKDPSVYIPIAKLLREFDVISKVIPNAPRMSKVLAANPTIRWTKPPTKAGTLHPKRRSVHLGDLYGYVLPISEGRKPTRGEIKARIQDTNRAKRAG